MTASARFRRRRLFLALGALLGVPRIACAERSTFPQLLRAQAADRVHRIGWLTGGSPRSHAKLLNAFRQGLEQRGWIEGRNIALEIRWAEGEMTRLPALAAELVRSGPDVIVTAANPVHLAMQKETSKIPIVMATGSDPVAYGLVKSLARPGGNITGLSGFFEATPIKMLELVGELVPRGARVTILVERNTAFAGPKYRGEAERTARAVGMRTEYVDVGTVDEVSRALSVLEKNPSAALVVMPGPMMFFLARDIVKGAARLNAPVIYPFEESVEAGGLISYAAPLADSYRRAAYYVDRILKGAKPGDLPIEQPTRLALAINLKTAKTLGLAIPPHLLLRAERVIE